MSKRLTELFLIDIMVAANLIFRYVDKIHCSVDFVENEAVFIIVTRELEIIGEAVNNILKSEYFQKLVSKSWRQVVDFRNVISHEYFGLNYEEIFHIVKKELPAFIQEVLAVIQKIKESENFVLALIEAKNDLQKIGRKESVDYLSKLEILLQ